MKALVFGGSGFIGSHVVEELLEDHYSVWNVDVIDFTPRKKIDNYHSVKLDISADSSVVEILLLLQNIKPDLVFNFAAVADIETCQKIPNFSIRVNVVGHTNILRAIGVYINEQIEVNKYSKQLEYIPKVIFASSVYVHNGKSGFYGVSKQVGELYTKCFAEKYRFPYTIIRYGTVYGPRASKGNSITNIIEVAKETKVLSYYGTGEEVREYIYVTDAAKHTVAVATTPHFYDKTVVISSVYPMKSYDMLKALKDILGDDYTIELRNQKVLDHYEVTPYCYLPDVAKKYVGASYYDLGAGLYLLVKDIFSDEL